jgi:thioredoxin 1
MPLKRRTQIAIIFIGILIVSAMAGCISNPKNQSKPVANTSQQDHTLELTDQSILQAINTSPFLVLDFYYPGCGACKFMNKTTLELANDLQGQIKFGKINVKTNSNTARKYRITDYPTLLFFDEGVLINRIKGNTSKSDLLAELRDLRPGLDTSKVQLQPVNVATSGAIPLASFGENKPSMPMLLTDDVLDSAIRKYPYLVVDAFATWCSACHGLNTTLLELSGELQGQVAFGLIDAEKNRAIKTKYNITSYPTMLIYKDGKMVKKLIGNRAKSVFLPELKKYDPNLDISQVKITQPSAATKAPAKPKQTPEQACVNMTKSDKPLLEAFVVSKCPFGLQMQRIMAEMVSKSLQSGDYLKIRYIGSITNNTITSMHGDEEAQENLRQICVREEQSGKYWDYVSCYMKDGKSADCLKSTSIDGGKLEACMKDSSRGLAYAQKDFDLANKFSITGSPTLTMNDKVVSEFDFATDTTNGRSPQALKELLCCGFNNKPGFCSQELNKTQAITMFSAQAKTAAAATAQPQGKDITLIKLGTKNPAQAMLITDDNINSAVSQYPLLVIEGFADWCGFCKSFNVTVSDLASELQGQVAFGLIDMDHNNITKTNYNITAYPTSLIFKDGKLADKVVGSQQKSSFVAKLKQIEPKLNTSKVKIVRAAPTAPLKPKLTPEQVCINMTKSDKPLLEAFVVSKCPFGLQMQRIMVNLISQSQDAENYLKVRYIGSVANNTITSMHGDEEAQENLRQICIREEQSDKYWDYVGCYMKEGKSADCLKYASVDVDKLYSCTNVSSRGLVYAQKDFDLANKFSITGSPTMLMGDKIVKESDFATNTTNGRSPEALKELLCCGFKNEPSFCSQELNKSRMATMFSTK